jgi:hypothetical protein
LGSEGEDVGRRNDGRGWWGEYKKVEIGKSRFNVEPNQAGCECKTKEWTEVDWELAIQDVGKTRTELYSKSPTKKTEAQVLLTRDTYPLVGRSKTLQ